MTVNEAKQIIRNTKLLKEHFATLMGERPSGSKWGGRMTQKILTHWIAKGNKVPPDRLGERAAPGCEYIYIDAEMLQKFFRKAECDIIRSDCFDREHVKVGLGDHGKELVYGKEAIEGNWRIRRADPRGAYSAWVILGDISSHLPESKGPVTGIYTLYPGPLTPALPKDWDGRVESLDLRKGYAVKREGDKK